MILTDGNGRPFAPIDPPAPDAPIEEKIAYLRAVAARNDAIATTANRAFTRAFKSRK
mgnify:CR=1 FL=1